MAASTVETLLKYKVDAASVGQAVASTEKVKAGLTGIGTAAEKAFTKIERQKAFDRLTQDALRLTAAGGKSETAVMQLVAQLDRLGASESEVEKVINAFDRLNQKAGSVDFSGAQGDISTATSSIASLAGNFGVDTGGVQIISDLTGVIEYLPKFQQGLKDTAATLQNAGGSIGQLASAGGQLGGMLGGVGSSVGSILAVAAPAAAAVGAVGLAISAYTSLIEEQARAVEAAKAQLAGDTQGRIDNALTIKTASSESVKAQLEEQKIKLEITRKDLADRRAQLEIVRQQYEALGASFDPAQRAALGQAGEVWEAEIARLTAAETDLAASVENTTNNILPAIAAREAEQKAIEDAEAALKKREQAEKTLATLADQRAGLESQAALQAGETAAARALRDAREQEDFDRARETTLAKHVDRLAAIEADGQQRIVDLRKQGVKRLADADKGIGETNQKIAELAGTLAKDISEAEARAAGDRAKTLDKARQDEQKALVDFNRRKRAIQQSFDDAAFDAELTSDVLALIEAERRRDAELKQNSEQFDDAKQQRQQALADELAKIEEQKQARIAEIQAAAEARRQELERELAERQAARAALVSEIQAQLEAEKTRIAETKKAAQDALTEQLASEDAARKLRLQRQAEDDRITDQQRRAALNRQLADIQAKALAEQQAAGLVAAAWTNAGKQAAAAAPAPGTSSSLSSPYRAPSSGGARQRIAFASGGIVTRPTVGLLGERPGYHEALIPFQQSQGIGAGLKAAGLTGGNQVVINLGSIGGDVSRAEVESNLKALGDAVLHILADARNGRLAA